MDWWGFKHMHPDPPLPPEPVDPIKMLIAESFLDEEWMGSLRKAITITIRQAFKDAVIEIVKEQIPESEHYGEIKAECAEQLRRWPALQTDPEMNLKVSQTILNSFQRTTL